MISPWFGYISEGITTARRIDYEMMVEDDCETGEGVLRCQPKALPGGKLIVHFGKRISPIYIGCKMPGKEWPSVC